MELTLTTPALLFPAISLLFLSYTNKFLALASLIRTLYQDYTDDPSNRTINKQLDNLHQRMKLIKHMQGAGIMSFIFCVIDMFLLYMQLHCCAFIVFGLCLGFLLLSLIICLMEIKISVDALGLQVQAMEDKK
ncbi:MAG: DUF2721 domain-containing protein [Endozoicomonas sp. (ex Botrylloides leachii)]|nr:DUF2721 domain-containing protein [Endozoicomonas sp. (ex Botrylloides leachii)]